MLGVYTYILWGNLYGMPYREMIESVLPIADEIVIRTDPRCGDGTIEAIEALREPKIRLIIEEFDFDNPGIDGITKAITRKACKSDILLQMDADEIVDPRSYDAIKALCKKVKDKGGAWINGAGVINWFNGDHFKYSAAGWTKERVSVNDESITHGIPFNLRIPRGEYFYAKADTTDGAGYIDTETGEGLCSLESACNKAAFPKDFLNPDSIWIHHYSWYCVPRKWGMKATWHFMWGNLYGFYTGVKSYHTDRDGNPVNFWQPQRLKAPEDYREEVLSEMQEKSIRPKPDYIKHPALMTDWLNSYKDYIYDPGKAWTFRRKHLMPKGRIN